MEDRNSDPLSVEPLPSGRIEYAHMGGARLDTNTAPTEAYFEGVLQGEVTIKHEDRFDAEYW